MFANRVMIGGSRKITLSFVASANARSSQITIPASGQEGDLAVLFDRATDDTPALAIPTDVVPAGWTDWVSSNASVLGANAALRGRMSYKILEAADPGASITGMNSDDESKVVLVFRPDIPITSVTASSANAQATAGNPASQTVTVAGLVTPLIVVGVASGSNAAAFSTENPAFDATVTTSLTLMSAGYKIYNSAPANHSIDMNDAGDANYLASGYLQIT